MDASFGNESGRAPGRAQAAADARPHGPLAEALRRCLAEGPTATDALERWCRARGIGQGPLRAEVLETRAASGPEDGTPAALALAGAGTEAGCARRVVRLCRGAVVLSEAVLHYRADWLTPAMRRALAEGPLPFGAIVAPLAPRRVVRRSEIAPPPAGPAAPLLREEAALLLADGRMLAFAEESYLASLAGF